MFDKASAFCRKTKLVELLGEGCKQRAKYTSFWIFEIHFLINLIGSCIDHENLKTGATISNSLAGPSVAVSAFGQLLLGLGICISYSAMLTISEVNGEL